MDIYVSIVCVDEVIRVKLSDLTKHEFFRNQLTCFNSTIRHERQTIKDSMDVSRNVDVYIIPELTVSCKSKILLKLIQQKFSFYIVPNKYGEDLLELMMYNRMYEFYHTFELIHLPQLRNTYIEFLLYVKRNLPQFNVFLFCENCDVLNYLVEYIINQYQIICQNTDTHIILLDLLECFDLMIEPCQRFDNSIMDCFANIKSLLGFMVWYCETGFSEKVKETFTTNKINFVLQLYLKRYEDFWKSFLWDDQRHKAFNDNLLKFFVEIDKLNKFDIALSVNIDSYKIHKKI